MDFTGSPFRVLLFVIDALVIATAFFGMWFAGRKAGAVRAAAGAVLALGTWFLPALAMPDIRGFALLARVCWTTATVTVPLFFLIHAASRRRAAWTVPALLLLTFKFYGEVWEQARLEVVTADIPVPGLKAPVKVAHLTDLQTDGIREMELRARAAANDFEPDLVLFTGDVLNHPSLRDPVFEYLDGWKAGRAKLFVGGDVDGGLDPEEFSRRTGFEWIDGRTVRLETAGGTLAVVGFGVLDFMLGADYGLMRVRQARDAKAVIAMSHRPDAAFVLDGTRASALFTGHTHGGQVSIPFWGPPLTLTAMPRSIAMGGVHRFKGLTVALSRGLGREGHFSPRVRLFCRPQLLLVRLVPEQLDSPREAPPGRAVAARRVLARRAQQ